MGHKGPGGLRKFLGRARSLFLALLLLIPMLLCSTLPGQAAGVQILGWNNLGMHCMDSDYSVFSILPPYNTIQAQLIVGGLLVTNGSGYSLTYQAVADPDGSFNSTSIGKGNFTTYAGPLYGAVPPAEQGLAGWSMPGVSNTPQSMLFERTNHPAAGVSTPVNWFRAEGIPITPYDDAGVKNPYPLMRIIARNAANQAIATNDIVLPVSDEMDCRTCHASGTQDAARPTSGWVWSGNRERDFRLNILRLHDERQFASNGVLYAAALVGRGFNSKGLYRGVVADNKPVLCASCHASEALGAGSFGNIPSLTSSMHSKHAGVMDPDLHILLDSSDHRAACYRCHPGSATKCLRGAMGGAVASDGSMSMQCQSCHGSMSQVGAKDRVGWFMEPNCQSCHTGTATSNNGQIRYTSVFETNGAVRIPANLTFATEADTPAPGISLYRFSKGHGGLQCSACHGSTHAEFPATHRNDNLRNERIQGHAGVMVECLSCHATMPANTTTAFGGPHGMHPIGSNWISFHHDAIRTTADRQKCASCHGADFRGTVLSKAQADRTFTVNVEGGTVNLKLFRGSMVGCYSCHNGPSSETINNTAAPVVANVSTNTVSGRPVNVRLPVTGAGATLWIVGQTAHGSVGLSNNIATYFPDQGFVGTDSFTFSAWNGAKNSLMATGVVTVTQGPFGLVASAAVPASYPALWPAAFSVVASPTNISAAATVDWNFGDGSPHGNSPFATHIYTAPGTYHWSVVSRVSNGLLFSSVSTNGTITVTAPVLLSPRLTANALTLGWPFSSADGVLERSSDLTPPARWTSSTNDLFLIGGQLMTVLPASGPSEFYRIRQVQ